MERKTPAKMSRSRQPKRVVRARAAARYPLVRGAPSRAYNFRPLNILARPPVLALKHRAKLLYSDNRVVTPTGANSAAYVYIANGLYDPDITGGGHQPMGFDQLMALYEHYTVLQAKITVSFVNESTTETGYVGIGLFPDNTVETIPSKLIENGLLNHSYIAERNGNSKSQVSLTIPVNIARINGRPASAIVGDEIYRGDITKNPTEATYFHVFAYNLATLSNMAVRVNVLIEYDAVFTEPRKLTQS